jgi:hypothetical protein
MNFIKSDSGRLHLAAGAFDKIRVIGCSPLEPQVEVLTFLPLLHFCTLRLFFYSAIGRFADAASTFLYNPPKDLPAGEPITRQSLSDSFYPLFDAMFTQWIAIAKDSKVGWMHRNSL